MKPSDLARFLGAEHRGRLSCGSGYFGALESAANRIGPSDIIDTSHIVDVTHCFATVGRGAGKIGRQCGRKPLKSGFLCRAHSKLDKQIRGDIRLKLHEMQKAGEELKRISKAQRQRNSRRR